MKTHKTIAVLVLGLGMSALASPVEHFPRQGGVIEGFITLSMDTNPSIMVDNIRLFVMSDTVIKTPSGTLQANELKVGMRVRVEGALVRGGFSAIVIYVLE